MKLVQAIGVAGLLACCALAEDKLDWSPAETTIDVRGTATLPLESRQKLGLPEKVAFEIKGSVAAKQIAKQQRSRASGKYSLVLRDPNADTVYFDIASGFSLESGGVPHQALVRAHELLGRSVSAALGTEWKSASPTNSLAFPLELKLDKFELKAK
jgi:hypothetical protein